jgi:hypothetical protein
MIPLLLLLLTQNQELIETKKLAPKHDAKMSVQLEDGTYADLVNDTYAIEIDYPRKWYEAIGQSLHYAEVTGKKPAIILLLRDPEKEWHLLVRCATICAKLDIKLYVEDAR